MSFFNHKFQRFLSYLIPLHLKQEESALSGLLEVTMYLGRCHLDAPGANYSFGSLHRTFQKAFRKAGLRKNGFSSVLVLGYGAGSVETILRKEYAFSGKLVGVEKDPVVLDLYYRYFHTAYERNTRLIQADALDFLKSNQETYDLVIVDLYIDKEVPEVFETDEFLDLLAKAMSKEHSQVFFNKMVFDPKSKESADALSVKFSKRFRNFRIIKVEEGYSNWIMVGRQM